jgi:hypothetical protein
MNSDDPPPPQDDTNSRAATNPARSGEAAGSKHGHGSQWRLWWAVILAAVTAASGAWLLGESGVVKAVAANAAVPTMGTILMAPTAVTTRAAEVKNTVRVFGVFGALLGLFLGLAGGWSRGNARITWAAAVFGAIAGGVTGAVGPLVAVPVYHRWQAEGADELIYSMAMHSAFLILPAAAAGLAFAIGLGNNKRLAHAALGGAFGALVGAVVYDLTGAFALPFANTSYPLATTAAARFVALIIPAIAIAAGAASTTRERRRAKA